MCMNIRHKPNDTCQICYSHKIFWIAFGLFEIVFVPFHPRKMSDTEEPTSSNKRKHSTENESEEQAEDEWIGPLPTDAAPNKKVKGKSIWSSLPSFYSLVQS